jgi:hypothetical protein
MGEIKYVYLVLPENLKGMGCLEDLGLEDRLILQWVLEN